MGAAASAMATREVFVALSSGPTAEAPGTAFPSLPLSILALSGAAIGACRIAENMLAERLGQDFSKDLRAVLFDHISRLPDNVFRDQRKGGLTLRFVGDLAAVRGWVSKGLTRMISASIVLPCSLAVLFVLHPALGWAAAIPMLLGLCCLFLIGLSSHAIYSRVRSRRARLSTDMTERIAIAPELRLLGRMPLELRVLEQKANRLMTAAISRAAVAGGMRAVPDVVSGLVLAAALGSALVLHLPVATTAGALVLVGLLIGPLRDLAGVWDRYRGWVVARDKCLKLLAKPTLALPMPRSERRVTRKAPSIEFRGVTHGPLHGFTLSIPAGTTSVLLGKSGSGKSTLLSLAAGLETPGKGDVRIGGKAAHLLPDHYRTSRVALLSSRSPIMRGSLRRALTLGLTRRPADTTLREAANDCGLEGVLKRLGGLDGRVEEAGANLSEGERWRVLLVRLMLGEFSIILLDSPESGLDDAGLGMLRDILQQSSATTLVATASEDVASSCGATIERLPSSNLPNKLAV